MQFPTELLDWSYLATFAGSTVFVMLVVQYFKLKVDKVWKIPTVYLVYFVSLVIQLVANYFVNQGLDINLICLCAVNAFLVAQAAMGTYQQVSSKIE